MNNSERDKNEGRAILSLPVLYTKPFFDAETADAIDSLIDIFLNRKTSLEERRIIQNEITRKAKLLSEGFRLTRIS